MTSAHQSYLLRYERDFTTCGIMLESSVFPGMKFMGKLVIWPQEPHHHRMFSGSELRVFQPIWTNRSSL